MPQTDKTAAIADTNAVIISYLPGILYMISGILMMSIMDGVAKWLVEADYSPFQILAVRGWIIVAMFMGYHAYCGTLNSLRSTRLRHHIVRASIGFLAPFGFFTALGQMPLADTVVIFFAAPFIMSALSFFLLKEYVGIQRWTTMIIGFVGMVIVVQPSGDGIHPAAIYAIIGCLGYSLMNIMTRWMSRTEPSFRFVFYFNLGTAIIGSCTLPFIWKDMTLVDVGITLLLAATALAAHLLLTKAFTSAPVSVIAPFEYTALLWSILIGYLVWNDFPDEHVWAGASIILVSGLYMLHRERVRKIKQLNKFIQKR